MKYVSKGTWFKKGTECVFKEYLYSDGLGEKVGIFEGIRICEIPDAECNRNLGEEYWSNEICGYDEFEVLND